MKQTNKLNYYTSLIIEWIYSYIGIIYTSLWLLCVVLAFTGCENQDIEKNIYVSGVVQQEGNDYNISEADVFILATELDNGKLVQYPIEYAKTDSMGQYTIHYTQQENMMYQLTVSKRNYDTFISDHYIESNDAHYCINVRLKYKSN